MRNLSLSRFGRALARPCQGLPWLHQSALVSVCFFLVTLCSCNPDTETNKRPAEPDGGNAEKQRAEENKTATARTAEQIREKYLSLMVSGKAHYENRSAAEAVQAFEQALALLPGELPAQLNLARACLLSQGNERALAFARQALQLDRHSVAALYLCGLASFRSDNGAEAVSYLERAVQLDPSSATMRFQLANALRLNDENARADDELRAVLQLDPNHWSAHFQLAVAARRAGDSELSQQYMRDYQRLYNELADSEKSTDALERCKYTVAHVPAGVHQPPEPIKVRLVPAAMSTRPDSVKLATPIAVFGSDANGRQRLLASDSKGIVRLLHSQDQAFEVTKSTLMTINSGKQWRARVADYNNDGLNDVFMFSADSSHLLKQAADSSFEDVAATAGITKQGARDAIWMDYDHDGDVDLLMVNPGGRLVLWMNRGNGTFVDESAAAKMPLEMDSVVRIAAADMHDDEAIDIVLATSKGPVQQLTNDGLGIFSRQDSDWPAGTVFVVEDIDNDLQRDVVIAAENQLHVLLADGRHRTVEIGKLVVSDIKLIDYDNDGWLDLLVGGRSSDSQAAGCLRLLRNAGAAPWQNVTSEVGLDEIRVSLLQPLLVADLDNDGDSDLLASGADGSAIMLRNDGGHQQGQLKMRLRGTRSNRSALGTLIEIRSGSFRLSRTVSEYPVEIGIAGLKELDSVRTIWPNGIVKNAIWVDPQNILNVEEPFVSAGSCPYLYAFNGQSFQFVTDILGASPLGLSLNRGKFVPANTNELVWVGDRQMMRPHGKGYAIQIADELREILYLDRVEMVVVDHPASTEAHSTTKLSPPPFRQSEIWTVGHRRDLLRAFDNAGNQWTDELQQIDGRYTKPPQLRPPQLRGLAKLHSLELDFGSLESTEPLVLVMTGWLQWGDASVNIAASQNPDLPNPWPRLEVWSENRWTEVDVCVGLPAGKTKTILVDLEDVLPPDTRRLRLTTAYEVYWDRIAMFARHRDQDIQQHVLPVSQATLQWRGFPRQIRHDARTPIVPDPTEISPTASWRTLPSGWCTRYGDITDLITETDDRLAIFNGGDASVIKFDGPLPNLPEGWRRDFFVRLDGWDKDSDYNVRCGDRVGPLPYHVMDEQRYGELPEPVTAPWMKRYNTRWRGPRLQ